MEIYGSMYNGMKCPKCGSELDTGFNCPKCKAKIYKETVSEYNTNGEKIYEKNTVKLVQPDPTWWEELSEEDKQIIREMPNFDAKIFEEITGIKEDK